MSVKVEEVLQEWPLSKVELISHGDEKKVRKSVHRDFGREALRQQAIYEIADGFTVPEIYSVSEENDKTVFTMEYFEPTRQPAARDADKLIRKFHTATESLTDSELFEHYTLANLENDLTVARRYGDLPDEINPDFFRPLFDNQTVLHGDWCLNQMIIHHDKDVMIDFGRSFVGPRILDYAHRLHYDTQGYPSIEDQHLLKAFITVDILRTAWFDLCKREYIDYDYDREMRAGFRGINESLDILGII